MSTENKEIQIKKLLNEKKVLESKLYFLNNQIETICFPHEWENDIIENPHNSSLYKIVYCKRCEYVCK